MSLALQIATRQHWAVPTSSQHADCLYHWRPARLWRRSTGTRFFSGGSIHLIAPAIVRAHLGFSLVPVNPVRLVKYATSSRPLWRGYLGVRSSGAIQLNPTVQSEWERQGATHRCQHCRSWCRSVRSHIPSAHRPHDQHRKGTAYLASGLQANLQLTDEDGMCTTQGSAPLYWQSSGGEIPTYAEDGRLPVRECLRSTRSFHPNGITDN